MNLKPLGKNRTQLEIGSYEVLFSYQTPVAARRKDTGKEYRTETNHSRTTQKHITQWLLNPSTVETKPQSFFDDLCA